MLFRTHLAFAILTALLVVSVLAVDNKLVFFAFAVLGGVFVDIDSTRSKMGKKLFLRPFQFFIKHRGIFHSLFIGVVLSLFAGFLGPWACFGFFLGYVSHLFLDGLTPAGVRLFWPFWNKKISFKIKTGGILEEIFFVLVFLSDVVFTIYYLFV